MKEVKVKKWSLSGLLLLLLVFASTFPVVAQEKKGPNVSLPERKFDFGEVKQGEVIRHTFKVINQGDETLIIEKVSPG
jgi:hypothetical protein